MAYVSRAAIKSRFVTGLRPTQADFHNLIDSLPPPVVDVAALGADPTGTASATAAVSEAIAAVTQLSKDWNEVFPDLTQRTLLTRTAGTLYFPKGAYLVGSLPEIPPFVQVIGGPAILIAENDETDILSINGLSTLISGIVFSGGARAIKLTHGNADSATTLIEHCTFNGQRAVSIQAIGNMSTALHVADCKGRLLGQFLISDCDEADLNNLWLHGHAPDIDVIHNRGSMTARNITLVPDLKDLGAAANTAWFGNGRTTDYKHGWLSLSRVRFGGENGGMLAVRHYAQAEDSVTAGNHMHSALIMDGCALWGDQSNVRLERVPNLLRITNTHPATGSVPRVIVAADMDALPVAPVVDVDLSVDTPALVRQGYQGVLTWDELLETNSYFGNAGETLNLGAGGSYAVSAEIPPWGSLLSLGFGTGADLYINRTYQPVDLPTGWYTLACVIQSDAPLKLQFGWRGAGEIGIFEIPGDNIRRRVIHHFFRSNARADIGLALYNVPEGATVLWGAPQLLPGIVERLPAAAMEISRATHARPSPEITLHDGQLYSSGPPTAGVYWYRGARILNSEPAAGEPAGWVCVETGDPGAWKAYADIAA